MSRVTSIQLPETIEPPVLRAQFRRTVSIGQKVVTHECEIEVPYEEGSLSPLELQAGVLGPDLGEQKMQRTIADVLAMWLSQISDHGGAA